MLVLARAGCMDGVDATVDEVDWSGGGRNYVMGRRGGEEELYLFYLRYATTLRIDCPALG